MYTTIAAVLLIALIGTFVILGVFQHKWDEDDRRVVTMKRIMVVVFGLWTVFYCLSIFIEGTIWGWTV